MRRWAVVGALVGLLAGAGVAATESTDTDAHPVSTGRPAGRVESAVAPDGSRWVGAWTMAPSGAVSRTGYAGYTIRNLVHTSIGGPRLRIRLSNVLGTKPLLVAHTTVGLQAAPGSPAIATGTLRDVTFDGSRTVTLPAGQEVVSDPVDLPLGTGSDVFVTTYTPQPSGPVTYHAAGLETSYFSTSGGDHAGDLSGTTLPRTTGGWHYVSGVEVQAGPGEGTVVALGDSITDGRNTTPGANRRWTDDLARRLLAGPHPRALGVLDAGISGNRILRDGAGVRALDRLDRDVLHQPGVRAVILLEGINDIQQKPHQLDASKIIGGTAEIARRAHADGIRIIGGTITPFEGWKSYSSREEATRRAVNSWIRSTPDLDGVVDFDAAVRDPADPHRLLPAYDSGDHLHPSDAGDQAMADAIDLRALDGR